MRPVAALDARLFTSASTGDTSYWRGLILALSRQPQEFQFLLFSNAARPPEIPDSPQIEWIHLPARSSRWWSLVAFPLAARRRGASLLHTQYTLSPLAKGGITTIHDLSFFVGPDWFPPKDRMILQSQVPASCRRAKAVLAVSETTRRDLEKWAPGSRGKTFVTPNALGANIQPMPQAEALDAVRRLGMEGPYLLTVGTRWPRKNMELAVAAADLLPASLPHRLAVTGKSGWGDQSLGARGAALGYVSDQDLTALYQCASLYLAPSRYEGFGIPLLEAFACSCPVLCSSGGAFPEVAGDAAFVEPSWKAVDWARRIESLLASPDTLQGMRERGLRRVADFSWDKAAQLTLDAYRFALSAS